VRRRHGHFKLESSHHADLWFDLETLCLNSREIRASAERLAARLKKYQVDVVCGPLVEGAFVALDSWNACRTIYGSPRNVRSTLPESRLSEQSRPGHTRASLPKAIVGCVC